MYNVKYKVIIKSSAHVQLHSFQVCEFNPMERTLHLREDGLIFWGIWGEAELILRIWGAKENIFRRLRSFQGFGKIFRDQGSTDTPPGASDLLM